MACLDPMYGPRPRARRRVMLSVLGLSLLIQAGCAEPAPEAPGAESGVEATPPPTASTAMEVTGDFATVRDKILGLAEAFAADEYDWRPSGDVRSSGEVFMHVAAVNYAFPVFTGYAAPSESGMPTDPAAPAEAFFGAIAAFEGTATSREEILQVLRASFEHAEAAMAETSEEMGQRIEFLDLAASTGGFWWSHTGHLHEHLGQLIAYGRMNGVAPPWS